MSVKVDVAIIGTGPAGGMAACELAGSGFKIAVVEKAKLPRHKSCGGLISNSATALFDWDITPLIENCVSSVRYYYNYEHPHSFQRMASPLLLINRARFDAGLIERAQQIGNDNLTLIEKYDVNQVTETNHHVKIFSKNRETIVADFLIAADGVASKTARCLGMNKNWQTAAAMDAEIEVSNNFYIQVKNRLIFNYFCLPYGYGWVFPKAENSLSCGVATWKQTTNLRNAMSDFIIRNIPADDLQKAEISGHPIPVYTGSSTIASRRVCLTGDAARLADPVSGEGIRFALQSGLAAAETIREIIQGSGGRPRRKNDCRVYQDRIHATMGKWLEYKYRFESLPFLKAPKYYYHRLLTGNRLTSDK